MGRQDGPGTDLGALVRRYRLRLGLTQEQLAERAGSLSVDTIANMEQGRNRPYRQTVEALAAALGLDEADRAALHAARTGTDPRPQPTPHGRSTTPAVRPAPVPVPLTRLIGREQDEAIVADLLRRTRLVTLTGPGGVGKTRLALQVAPDLRDAFADGIAWVDLAAVREPAAVLPAIARALGLHEDGAGPLEERLVARLQAARLLLVLDNFEQVAGAAPALGALLESCPALAALVTSRAALRIRGEHQHPVAPLALPPPDAPIDPPALAQVPAVALFLERGRAVRPTLELSEQTAATITAICRRLDGLPLALELAAARLLLFSPQALLARLAARLPLLVHGAHDLPARQRTLRATIAWSYDLLRPAERLLFRRLGVFAGGCTLEAAAAVCGSDVPAHHAPPAVDVLETVAALREHHLVQVVDDAAGEPRILLLETLREYAMEQLAATDEADAVHAAHAAYYLALAQAAGDAFDGAEVGAWMRLLTCEHENLQGALAWALQRRDAACAVQLASATSGYWNLSGQARAGLRWLEEALSLPGPLPEALRADARRRAARLAENSGELPVAQRHLEAALGWYRSAGDATACAALEHDLALVRTGLEARLAPEERRARMYALYDAERGRCERAGDTAGVAMAILNMGRQLLLAGQWAQAQPLLREALAQARRHGLVVISVYAHLHLGLGLVQAGDIAGAQAHYTHALQVAGAAGDRVMLTYGLEACVGLALARGQAPRAAELAGAAARARAALGVPLEAEEQALYEGWIAVAQAQVEAAWWEDAWRQGHARTLEQAVGEALAGLGTR